MLISIFLLIHWAFLHGSICGACLNGYTRFDESCYHVSRETENWAVSMITCKLDNAYLAEISSSRENAFLQNELVRSSVSTAWIGANDLDAEGDWRFGSSKEPVVYSNWHPGQPDNHGGQQCATLSNSGKWDDYYCHNAVNYICEMPYDTQHETLIG